MDHPFELTIGGLDERALRVQAFSGREEMSRPYTFEVVAAHVDGEYAALEDTALGAEATLVVDAGHRETQRLHGVVVSIQAEGSAEWGAPIYRIRLGPRLLLLGKSATSRIFQDLTVPQIIDAVLAQHGIARSFRLAGTYAPRVYCVQYRETDLAFVMRLLAEEGMYFSFVHPADARAPEASARAAGRSSLEVLVIGDAAERYLPIDASPVLVSRPAAGASALAAEEHHVTAFRTRASIEPTSVLVRGFDFTRPLLEVRSAAGDAGGDVARSDFPGLRVYEHRGERENLDLPPTAARTQLEQLRASAVEQEGASACRRLRPGRTFVLHEHAVERWNRAYVVTAVDHSGVAPEIAGPSRPVYENRFTCVPAGVCFRPPRPSQAPRQVVETATVVGPEGQEIHVDTFGRVKVQFHWDLDGQRNEHSSCWMRVAQPWAGSTWGFQFIPRVGMEVVVTFLGGDLDRPLVTGCVYNALDPTPHLVPGDRTRSGIRTRSSPGGEGFNELAFEDRKGAEQVYLRAERNLDEAILADRTSTVGGNRTAFVARDDTTTVQGSQSMLVGGGHALIVEGNLSTQARADRSDETRGDRADVVGKNLSLRVAGVRVEEVGADAVGLVAGDHTLRVEGESSVHVGTVERPSGGTLYAFGDYSVGAGKSIRLRAEESIVLECGESVIEITPERVRIDARHVEVNGAKTTTVRSPGPSIHLAGGIELAAGTIELYAEASSLLLGKDAVLKGTKATVDGGGAAIGLSGNAILSGGEVKVCSTGASLVLDACASLDGALVKLNCGGGGASAGASGGSGGDVATAHPVEKKPLKVRLYDGELTPYRQRRYVLVVAGERFEGKTDDDGVVEAQVAKHAESGSITLWTGAYPTSQRINWSIRIEDLPPADTPSGARMRLANLSYYLGPPVSTIDDDLRDSIEQFQLDHDLDVNGTLDPPTVAKLVERHGH